MLTCLQPPSAIWCPQPPPEETLKKTLIRNVAWCQSHIITQFGGGVVWRTKPPVTPVTPFWFCLSRESELSRVGSFRRSLSLHSHLEHQVQQNNIGKRSFARLGRAVSFTT